MSAIDWLILPTWARGQSAALLLMRLAAGAFLVHGVWDNIESAERMQEFAGFLSKHHFPLPALMAPLSVWAQFVCGACFVVGFATRWAGLICVLNFVVACLMVHLHQDFRGWWPALALVLMGGVLATAGPGWLSIDHWLHRQRQQRA
jgi:putative oxidoreductase